jgi:hypothetical protein
MNECPTRFTSADTACALDRLGHGPGGADVVDHLAARLLRSIDSAKSAVMKSPGHELAGVVDEEAAVGVTVVRDAEIGALRSASSRDELAVLGQQRVGLVMGNEPSGSK